MPQEDININKELGERGNETSFGPMLRSMKSDMEMYTRDKLSTISATEKPEESLSATKNGLPPAPNKRGDIFLVIMGVVITSVLGAYLYQTVFPSLPIFIPGDLIIPPSSFAVESSRTIEVASEDSVRFKKLIKDAAEEAERAGVIKRIVVKLREGEKERLIEFKDLLNLYGIKPPTPFSLAPFVQPFMVFIHHTAHGSRLGFLVNTTDAERAIANMLRWEESLAQDFQHFLLEEKSDSEEKTFEDRSYRNINWRYLKLSQEKDLGIGYGVFRTKKYLIVVTSKETMERIIDRLLDTL